RRRSETSAAKTSVMSAWMERNDCMSNSESFGDRRANGPYPCVVPTTAIAHTTQMTAEVSRGPKRNAAQMRNGVQRNVQGSFLTSECSSGPKTIPEISRSEEHTSELQSRENVVCRLLLE